MTYKLILNAEIGHLEFLNKDKKFLNGDIEVFNIAVYNYFRSKSLLITILVTNKTWVKRKSNFRKKSNIIERSRFYSRFLRH